MSNIPQIPTEVLDRQSRYWGKDFDPRRLVYYPKATTSKCDAWIAALKTKIATQGEKRNGWRKCHTGNYWCYYAKYVLARVV